MAKYFTNFIDQPVGDITTNGQTQWAVKIANGTSDFRVLADGAGAKYLRLSTTGNNGSRVVAFNSLNGVTDNLDTLTLFSVFRSGNDGSTGRYGINYNRYSGTSEATTKGWAMTLTPVSSVKSLLLYEDSTGSITSLPQTWSMGTKYWARFRTIGNAQYMRMWAYGTAEPVTWNLTGSASAPSQIAADTYTGVGTYAADSYLYVYQYSAGTAGDVAPMFPDEQIMEDQFEDTDKNLTAHTGELGATWVSSVSGKDLQVYGGRAKSPAMGSPVYSSGVPASPNYYVTANFMYLSTPGDMFVTARHQPGAVTYYGFGYNGSAWQIRGTVGGIMLVLATVNATLNAFQTYEIRFSVQGNNLSGWVDGVRVLTVNDTMITSTGRVGLIADMGSSGGTSSVHVNWMRAFNNTSTDKGQTGAFVVKVPVPSSTPQVGYSGSWGGVMGWGGTAFGQVLASGAVIVDKNQTGQFRVKKVLDNPQVGMFRVRKTFDQSVIGRFRVRNTYDKTQVGQFRVKAILTKNQTGAFRVRTTSLKNQLGQFRVRATYDKAQLGAFRITSEPLRHQSGMFRVRQTYLKNQLGQFRIATPTDRTQVGKFRVRNTYLKTQVGQFRVRNTYIKNQVGNFRVKITSDKAQLGQFRVSVKLDKAQVGRFRVLSALERNQIGKFRVRGIYDIDQPGRFRVQANTTKAQVGRFRVERTYTKAQTGRFLVEYLGTKPQVGQFRVYDKNTFPEVIIDIDRYKPTSGAIGEFEEGGIIDGGRYIPTSTPTNNYSATDVDEEGRYR